MKVILLKNIENLGQEGEVKNVANGYARNYLLPNQLAVLATDNELKKIEKKKKEKADKSQMALEEAQKLAELLEGRELYVKAKEKDGKLFGSVNEKTIAKTFKDEGTPVNAENINLGEPIKDLGEFDVRINLDHGLEANIKVIVVGDE